MDNTYVVAVIHSFSWETSAYGFDNLEDAQSYLKWLWDCYYNEEKENNSRLLKSKCYLEDDYGRITWVDDEYTEFILLDVLPPDRKWPKDDDEKDMDSEFLK